MSMRQLAKLPNSFPLSAPTTYEGDQVSAAVSLSNRASLGRKMESDSLFPL